MSSDPAAAKELFLALRGLSPAVRAERLMALAAGDSALAAEVASLLSWAGGDVDGDAGAAAAGDGDAGANAERSDDGGSPAGADAPEPGGVPTPSPPPTVGPPVRAAAPPRPAAAERDRSRSGEASGERRFSPGDVFAGRYRIVEELGRGGMGRVFRAQDLVLGEDVALKLLTGHPAPGRVRRLVEEVRLARQVAHPNVCRVHDFGDAEGETFLSMEYVDGEDLRSLLGRVGRLPAEKLHDAAQQLCAGLAAIHARGILHCDLKPANVLVDGRGNVRISDFGLATAAASAGRGDVLGTPAYMAPELWRGNPCTVATDVWALGLVLHEMATGERVGGGGGQALARRWDLHPPELSSRLGATDPRFDAVVRQCIEVDPEQRPPSVAAVAAALPEGDRLELALAAGELPSPDTVARAQLPLARRRSAVATAAVLAVALAVAMALGERAFPGRAAWNGLPPDVAVSRAGELLAALGHELEPVDRAWGFLPDPVPPVPDSVLLWYRQSPEWLVPADLDLQGAEVRVQYYDPPPLEEGTVQMLLDARGRLVTLKVLPASFAGDTRAAVPAGEPPWPALLAAAGVPADAPEVTPQVLPPVLADRRRAWETQRPDAPGVTLRLEAAALGDRVVFADVSPTAVAVEPGPIPEAVVAWVLRLDTLLWAAVAVAALALARVRLGDGGGDQHGARQIGLLIGGAAMLRWALASDHLPLLDAELTRAAFAAGRSLAEGLVAWLAYLALEPTVRRYWPHALVAWTRLLRGAAGDAAVGRSLLTGAAAGAVLALVGVADRLLVRAAGLPTEPEGLVSWQLETGLSARRWLAAALETAVDGLYWAVLGLFLLAVLRRLFGRPLPALVAWVLLYGAYGVVAGAHPAVSWATLGLATAAGGAFVLVRGGLLAWAVALGASELLLGSPLTTELAVWYGEAGVFAALTVLATGAVGLWLALRGGGAATVPVGRALRPAGNAL